MLNSIIPSTGINLPSLLICLAVSLILGLVIAFSYMFRSNCNKGFFLTLVLLPMTVQIIILLVNGQVGTGIAVAGAFSLVRFRSAPGSAKEIASVFLAMAVGLGTGMGYIGIVVILTIIACAIILAFTLLPDSILSSEEKTLRITIPEELDYTGIFDDLFMKYTKKYELTEVKTTNVGSLYRLSYLVVMKNPKLERQFINELRCRNGNLEISCGKRPIVKNEL